MNKGKVAQVIGPVVDVDFSNAKTPAVSNALTIENADGSTLYLEVAQHLGLSLIHI